MTKEVEPELVERMANAIRRHARGLVNMREGYTVEAEFRAIASELPEPVDPDLIEARRIAATAYQASGGSKIAVRGVLDGNRDDDWDVIACLTAIKRGRELAQVSA